MTLPPMQDKSPFLNFYLFFCACMHVDGRRVHMCMYALGGQESLSSGILQELSILFFDTASLEPGPHQIQQGWLESKLRGPSISHVPSTGIPTPRSLCGFWGSNSSTHACMARALTTESPLLTLNSNLLKSNMLCP